MPQQSWLDELIELHSEFESPQSFYKWAGLVAIAAIAKDNIYLRQKGFNLYPNVYVMLHADSGLKKSAAINVAKKLVKEVGNTKIISGRSSIQGILRKLGETQSQPGGKIKGDACGFICSSELSASLVDDPAATSILTDLYDRHYNSDDYGSLLKSEEFSLKEPTVSMFSATNDSMEFLQRREVSGGFLARTFVVHETEENRPNSLLVFDEEDKIDYIKLSCHLKEIAKLRGHFLSLASKNEDAHRTKQRYNKYDKRNEYFTPAGLLYEEWYDNFKKEVKGVKDQTGTLNRFGTSVLKVAMLLSLSKGTRLEIDEDTMEEAIVTCEKLVGNARKITFGKVEGDPTDANRKKILLLELMQRDPHSITHTQLNKKYWMQGTVKEWEETVLSLQAAEIIDIKPIAGSQLLYEMKDQAYKELKSRLEGKN